ncbi:MAG: sialate O-acetylesterase [Bacteroidales bacterium]
MYTMTKARNATLLLFFVMFNNLVFAQIKLPALVGNNMVLQQKTEVHIWGQSTAGDKLSISASWMTTKLNTVAAKDGKWKTKLPTIKAGGPYTITIQGNKDTVVIHQVMLGEVWLCSGQSNMEFTINMLGGWKETYPSELTDLQKEGYPNLRLFTVKKASSPVPIDSCNGQWLNATPENVGEFSATAFFFGRELSRKLNVPVGLINSSWGGSPAEAWTSETLILKDSLLRSFMDAHNGSNNWPGAPGAIYNAMIHPLHYYGIRGAIWYQGEANRNDPSLYPHLIQTMITGWRKDFNCGNFPFYFVQIAPFAYEEPLSGALLREAQLESLSILNTGMVVTLDIAGDTTDIHPKNKQDVGKRLSLLALSKTYGQIVDSYSGPVYKGMTTEGAFARLAFEHCEGGLKAGPDGLKGFTIAGSDSIFYPAQVIIDGNTLMLSNTKVKSPIAVRYAFINAPEASLFNGAGFPASSFRTDKWLIVNASVKIAAAFDPVKKELLYSLESKPKGFTLRYTLNDNPKGEQSKLYTQPFAIAGSCNITAKAYSDGVASIVTVKKTIQKSLTTGKKVKYINMFDPKYTGGGDFGLVDGLKGSSEYSDGSWQGFSQKDMEIVIDLGEVLTIHKISATFLQNEDVWIFLPQNVKFAISENGSKYSEVGDYGNPVNGSTKSVSIKEFTAEVTDKKARFIKVIGRNIGNCPSWHVGSGGAAWLFTDEVVVE